ncbi:hypothetical protein KH172YL63_11050 [Bacillus sp. KH172YL63]|nr:hypothetical protein KH172YL63_11050 [Bacillus sp. KH172YL63]
MMFMTVFEAELSGFEPDISGGYRIMRDFCWDIIYYLILLSTLPRILSTFLFYYRLLPGYYQLHNFMPHSIHV